MFRQQHRFRSPLQLPVLPRSEPNEPPPGRRQQWTDRAPLLLYMVSIPGSEESFARPAPEGPPRDDGPVSNGAARPARRPRREPHGAGDLPEQLGRRPPGGGEGIRGGRAN